MSEEKAQMGRDEHGRAYGTSISNMGMDKKAAMKQVAKDSGIEQKRRLSGTVTDTLTLNNVPFVNLYRK